MNNNKNENHCQVLGIDINSHFFNYDSDKGQFHQSESTVAPIFSKLVNTTELVADTDPEAVIKNNTPIESYATWNNKNNALVLRGAYQDNPISKLDFVFSSRECTYSINSKLVFQEKFTMHSSSYTEKPLMPLSDHYGVLANIFFNTNKIQRKSFF